jgi:hypothetical protein
MLLLKILSWRCPLNISWPAADDGRGNPEARPRIARRRSSGPSRARCATMHGWSNNALSAVATPGSHEAGDFRAVESDFARLPVARQVVPDGSEQSAETSHQEPVFVAAIVEWIDVDWHLGSNAPRSTRGRLRRIDKERPSLGQRLSTLWLISSSIIYIDVGNYCASGTYPGINSANAMPLTMGQLGAVMDYIIPLSLSATLRYAP